MRTNQNIGAFARLFSMLMIITVITMYSLPVFAETGMDDDSGNMTTQEQSAPDHDDSAGDNGVSNTDESDTDEPAAEQPSDDEGTPAESDVSGPTVPAVVDDENAADEEEPAGMVPMDVELDEVWVSSSGNDENNGSSSADAVKTLAQALELVKSGGTIHLVNTTTVSEGVSSNKTVTITGSGNGIAIANGGSLSVANMTMTGFGTAITVNSGGTIGDGNYTLDGNTKAFQLNGGTIKGSSRSSLAISAKESTLGWSRDAVMEKCSITQTKSGSAGSVETGLNLVDAYLSTQNIYYYMNYPVNMNHSDWIVDASALTIGTGIMMGNVSNISNGSSITVKNVTGSWGKFNAKGITTANRAVNIEDSTLTFEDTGFAGLNVNSGTTTINNSTITGSDYTTLLYGSQAAGKLIVKGNSVINTKATASEDNGGGAANTYIVIGGSHKVKYTGGTVYFGGTSGRYIPVNGEEHGNESLSYFKLADSSVTELQPVDINGDSYTYSIANASDDGNKYVWVPGVTVTFTLNNAKASFDDGTKADKELEAMRGYAMKDVVAYGDNKTVEVPTVNAPNDQTFLGWFYRDANNTEQAFTEDTILTADTEVYAKWNNYRIIYHSGDNTYTDTVSTASTDALAIGMDEITANDADFKEEGQQFKYWTTDPEEATDAAGNVTNKVEPGDTLDFESVEADAEGAKTIHLYAQYEPETYTMSYSANGGVFTDDSVFKQYPDVFTITTDEDGGEVATINHEYTYRETISDGLIEAGYPNGIAEENHDALYQRYNLQWGSTAGGGSPYIFNAAVRKYRVPRPDEGLFGTVEDSSSWYNSPSGDWRSPFTSQTTMIHDRTVYLQWDYEDGIDPISAHDDLYGDMWGTSQANTTKIETKKKGESFHVVGAYQTDDIKAKMDALETQFPTSSLEDIELDELKSSFTAVITVPEEVEIPNADDLNVSSIEGADCFYVDGDPVIDISARTITITIKFDANGIENYQQLKDAISGVDEWLIINLDGFKLAESAQNDEIYTFTGTVEGSFHSMAIYPSSSKKMSTMAVATGSSIKAFDFTWGSTQLPEGKDEAAKDDATISYSIQAMVPEVHNIYADIAIGDETEHDAVYKVEPGKTYAYSGFVDAKYVKNQIQAIENQFPALTNYEAVTLEDVESEFTAVLTLPEGLSFMEASTAKLDNLGDNPLFVIDKMEIDGQTATVTMKIRDDITNYQQLRDGIAAFGDDGVDDNYDWMKVTIDNVKVSEDAPVKMNLTAIGTVDGSFSAVATSSFGMVKNFAYEWHGIQNPEGRDFIDTAETDNITFTVYAEKKSGGKDNTNTKDNTKKKVTEKTDKSSKTSQVNTGDRANLALYAGILIAAVIILVILMRRKTRK